MREGEREKGIEDSNSSPGKYFIFYHAPFGFDKRCFYARCCSGEPVRRYRLRGRMNEYLAEGRIGS